MRKGIDLLIGGSGITGIELIQNIDIPDVSESSKVVSTLIQILIGIATLVGLFRKKKS